MCVLGLVNSTLCFKLIFSRLQSLMLPQLCCDGSYSGDAAASGRRYSCSTFMFSLCLIWLQVLLVLLIGEATQTNIFITLQTVLLLNKCFL